MKHLIVRSWHLVLARLFRKLGDAAGVIAKAFR